MQYQEAYSAIRSFLKENPMLTVVSMGLVSASTITDANLLFKGQLQARRIFAIIENVDQLYGASD